MRDLWYPKDQRKPSHKKDEVFIAARCCREVKMRSEKKKKSLDLNTGCSLLILLS